MVDINVNLAWNAVSVVLKNTFSFYEIKCLVPDNDTESLRKSLKQELLEFYKLND